MIMAFLIILPFQKKKMMKKTRKKKTNEVKKSAYAFMINPYRPYLVIII
jgi:hypothetical protein